MAGGGGPVGPNMAALTSQMGFNASGYAGIHEIVFGRLKLDYPIKLDTFYAWLSSIIPHKNSIFARKIFSLNSRAKGMSVKDLAPDARTSALFSEQKGIS
jgi:hypothetical protein